MILSPPKVPWQITGNHWLTIPCIHPVDASIHLVGSVHARSRGAVEFSGGPSFIDGTAPPFARITLDVDGQPSTLGAEGLAWEREAGWIPAFSCRVGDLAVRGTICAPFGKNADVAGAVIALSIENRGTRQIELRLRLEGTLGHRQLRVRTARDFTDGHSVTAGDSVSVLLEGRSAESPVAMAIGGEGDFTMDVVAGEIPMWSLGRGVTLAAGAAVEDAFHIAAGAERDGAAAVLGVMRRRGAHSLISETRSSLRAMEPATGNVAADRLISRHLFFAFFCAVARAIDDAHVYVVRSRIPWNGRGMTIRDWEALTWVLPAVQLASESIGRELLLRVCELHGYAPGSGVHYLDGSVFEPGFSLEGAAAYAIAVDAYIVHTSDDRVVEEPALADSLYGSNEDIEARRHSQLPLYSTQVNPDGTVPEHPYTLHGNAVVALAFDVLSRTLDEKTAEKVEDSAAVRAATLRQFGVDSGSGRTILAAASDLAGNVALLDQPSASMYWLPYFDLIARDDSMYRRTVKRLEAEPSADLVVRCARLMGPSASEALDWLRRAPLDGGIASEQVDADGRATGNGGDAALSGLIAHTVWYAVHALGAKL